jgi:cation transport regulator ChaC
MEFVFGYGSLVSPASAAATLGHDLVGYAPARLAGMRRAWVVGSDATSHPERAFLRADGSVFTGVTVVLGLVPDPVTGCGGAVFAVDAADLTLLDLRERNYRRVDVTGRVTGPGHPPPHTVWAYVPRQRAVARLRSGRELRVRAQYVAVVEAAFAAIGRLDAYRRDTPVPPVPVESLRAVPSASAGRRSAGRTAVPPMRRSAS